MKIIISQGDSNGIGLEVAIKALRHYFRAVNAKSIEFGLAANLRTLNNYLQAIGENYSLDSENLYLDDKLISLIPCETYSEIEFGKVTASAGKLSGEAIDVAIKLVKSGEYDALVTMPINKESLSLGGYDFTGHTEFLANRCGVEQPLMILCTKGLNVALATIHIPLSAVSSSINEKLLHKRFRQMYISLVKDYGEAKPKIAVLSLNPHAGENGKLGTEENEIIIPAMASTELKPFLYGPFAADGFFAHGDYKKYNGVIAMYHDQGLIPLKMLANGAGVNFTAGLPIIRTSPDHGTGFAIAGKGVAEYQSTLAAFELAEQIYNNRQ